MTYLEKAIETAHIKIGKEVPAKVKAQIKDNFKDLIVRATCPWEWNFRAKHCSAENCDYCWEEEWGEQEIVR